jgi:predicted nucleotidyltransferase
MYALLAAQECGTLACMDRDYVITRLREHEPELKAAGIVHLRLHGSLARGTATATSDVDLIAELDASKRLSLLDMVGLENRLSDLLGARVDLSPQHTLKQPVASRAAQEAVLAF